MPIVQYTDGKKSGTGISSGEFDVDQYGVLVVQNVSLHHEHPFTAAFIHHGAETPLIINVFVHVMG